MPLPQIDQMKRMGYGGEWYYTVRVSGPGGNYMDTWDGLAKDFGQKLPDLPSAPPTVRGRIYVNGVSRSIVEGTLHKISDEPMPWDLRDQIIAAIPAMLSMQYERNFPADGFYEKKASKQREMCAIAKRLQLTNYDKNNNSAQEKLGEVYRQIEMVTNAKDFEAIKWPE